MHWPLTVRWLKVVDPTQPIAETVVRGTLLYLALILILRFVLKREKGQLGATDLLLIVLLGDAAQNAMAGSYTSVTDGVVLILTLVFWNSAFNWLAQRFRLVERFLSPSPIMLVRDGRMLWKHMAHELITEQELMSQLRLQGVDDLAHVRAAYVEGDGRISVLTYEPQPEARGAPERDSA
ncbi:MAG TPA: YetF domain-containing protein [Ktedonobacterales bacterium]|jgi:uncharacterized membrane protein YcaP (DUF421 family)|nr:YetF domain-containing protein [Ktedonobacterales bacterium]